jgi:hypothetical protein
MIGKKKRRGRTLNNVMNLEEKYEARKEHTRELQLKGKCHNNYQNHRN